MNFDKILNEIKSLNKETGEKIEEAVDRLDKSVRALQRQLLEMVLTEFLKKLKLEGNRLVNSAPNLAIVSELDKLFDEFELTHVKAQLGMFAADLILMWELSKKYFEATGNDAKKVAGVESRKDILFNRIGITASGKLVKGGYLYELGRSSAVRQSLKNYVLNAINNKVSLADYTNGLRALVVGNKDVDGSLVRYYRQYAYDSFNQVHEVANQAFADGLGLEHFIYEGSNIATTRPFCRKRAGKVFSVKETEKWKNDPDLVEPKTRATYSPLIERGRYNCRHFIRYISDELAFEIRPDLRPKQKK